MTRLLSALVAALVAVLATGAAVGAPSEPTGLGLEAAPVLGAGSPAGTGWFAVGVRLHNSSEQRRTGRVELQATSGFGSSASRVVTWAPFDVAPGASVSLELPTRGLSLSAPELAVRALDEEGRPFSGTERTLPEPRFGEPLLFELAEVTRIGTALRGLDLPSALSRSSGRYQQPQITVSVPGVEPSGDLFLPSRASGYAPVTVALSRSSRLATLGAERAEALANWVLAGGTLAVVIDRPEDLRAPWLTTLVGGELSAAEVPAALRKGRSFVAVASAPGGYGSRRFSTVTAAPDAALALTHHRGGNLRATPWGSAASYGLGELHVLAYDPTQAAAVNDRWVQLSTVDLLRHAWERALTVALPHGQDALEPHRAEAIRKQLDPNERTRWAIGVATLLLLLYAVLAGPVSFHLASRRGRPLQALWHLPLWSAGCLACLVVLGMVSRGTRGQARHLSLLEAGAGSTRAAMTRFRGFFAGSADALTLRAWDPRGVLELQGDDVGIRRFLVVDRDGARLERFQARPWETLVVREDAFRELGGGVSVVARGEDAVLVNRLPRDLAGVVARLPGSQPVYLGTVPAGGSVLVSTGKPFPHPAPTATGGRPSRLHASDLTALLDSAVVGLTAAWAALEQASPNADWWPPDAPVVLGQLVGGEGRTSDAGLTLTEDRVLLRVVGWGGTP